jgi:hypothetical protein
LKNVPNKISFPLVTHMTCFDIRFCRYGILKLGSSSGQILDRLGIQVLDLVLGHNMSESRCGLNKSSEDN